jgi:hypothetical protein
VSAVLEGLGLAGQRGLVAWQEDRHSLDGQDVFDGVADPGLGLEAVRGEGVTLDVQDAQGAVRDQDRGRGDRAAGGCRSRKVRAPLPGAWGDASRNRVLTRRGIGAIDQISSPL